MFTAIIPILCNINPCMLFLLSIEKKKKSSKANISYAEARVENTQSGKMAHISISMCDN